MKFGRYGLILGRYFWMQTKVPVRVWNILFIWFFKEARPQDISKVAEFPPDTRMEYGGRTYRYWKKER